MIKAVVPVRVWLCVICITLCAIGWTAAVLTAQVNQPPQPKWSEIKPQAQAKCASKQVEERLAAIRLIDSCWLALLNNKNDAIEALQMVMDLLAKETDESVVATAVPCVSRLGYGNLVFPWLEKQFDALKNDTLKARLIDAFGYPPFQYGQVIKFYTKACTDKNPKIRLAVIKAASRTISKSFTLLVSLISDKDMEVSLAALNAVATVSGGLDYESLPQLINLLPEERPAVEEKIVQTIETFTGQKFGDKKADWLKWLGEREKAKITPREVDIAINKARDSLLQNPNATMTQSNDAELVFYALVHAGVSSNEPVMKSLLDHFMTKQLDTTYHVSLIATALADINKVKYQGRLVQCAQFLLGNESREGNWSYGAPLAGNLYTPIPDPKDVPDNKPPDDKKQTIAAKKVPVKVPPRLNRPAQGGWWDSSNTQYAILGLRACALAGLDIPKEAWADAEKHLLRTQGGDGGWNYQQGGASYGSMTAGGLCALVICLTHQDKDIASQRKVKAAIDWLGKNFTVRGNPCNGDGQIWHYYYLYALERAGVVANVELFGKNDWYQIGARYLLDKQKKDGSWQSGDFGSEIEDTCFAILFLRRATRTIKAIETGK